MHQEGSRGHMSLIGAIKELDGVIDSLFVCGEVKLLGINCVIT